MTETMDIAISRNVRIPLRDGITLSADLYRPKKEGRYPAIVVRTPYLKNTTAHYETSCYFAEHGYAVLVIDVRGRGDSEGEFIPYRLEAEDGYDCIE